MYKDFTAAMQLAMGERPIEVVAVNQMMAVCVEEGPIYITKDQANAFFGTVNNIWGTTEADAWSRDFGYGDYLALAQAKGTKPVSEKAYELFRQAFHQAMEDDMEFIPVQGTDFIGGGFTTFKLPSDGN